MPVAERSPRCGERQPTLRTGSFPFQFTDALLIIANISRAAGAELDELEHRSRVHRVGVHVGEAESRKLTEHDGLDAALRGMRDLRIEMLAVDAHVVHALAPRVQKLMEG